MREILFRGKGTHGFAIGKWVYGNYAKDFWGNEHKGFGILPLDGGYSEVDPETVGQYTGLLDKNGNKIFEGDILKIDGSIYYVKFHNGTFGVVVKNGGYAGSIPKVASYVQDFIEIIGNIHDNPELLKGGAE